MRYGRNLPTAPPPGAERAERERLPPGELRGSRLDDVAGHRVMRRFAVGSRATLLLARPSSPSAEPHPRARLVKVFHAETSASSIDVELAALSAPVNTHVVRLIDVATVGWGEPPCLVLERLPGPALSAYLDDQQRLTAGQAVTILAPLCAAVQALHEAGVTHGAVHLRRIVFDQRGAPVLTGFGRGALLSPPLAQGAISGSRARPRTGEPAESPESVWRSAVLEDHRGLLSVIEGVLAHVDPGELRGFDIATSAAEVGIGPSADFLARVEGRLFAMASPNAISLQSHAPVGAPTHSPAREPAEQLSFVPAARPTRPSQPTQPTETTETTEYDWQESIAVPSPTPAENRLVAALRILGAPSSVLEIVSRIVDAAAQRSNRIAPVASAAAADTGDERGRPARRLGRRPLLVGAFCAVVAATVLLLALPVPRDQAQAGVDVVASSEASEVPGPTDEPQSEAMRDDATLAQTDDPAAALRALSEASDGCAAAAEQEACLTAVFQPDYLASDVDAAGPLVIDASEAIVTGAWGGSALVAARLNDQPASFLLMKEEAGWRVRDVFVSDQ
ncbi:protein kinase [Agreia sp. Leaf283]|uniref:protein kinase n=1 Tax=Agreia sp. Leaf283 TaxID=1736321 RepID=UPI0006FA0023|nr:protein kinase [Agreia sp. Leaf283]KQP55605.1 hypothetical protein ASF51_10495 [Agreia sp. Leaf283]